MGKSPSELANMTRDELIKYALYVQKDNDFLQDALAASESAADHWRAQYKWLQRYVARQFHGSKLQGRDDKGRFSNADAM